MTAAWLDEVEPATAPPFVRMGTRGLRGQPWLLGGDDVAGQLAEKARILAEHDDEVVAALPGSEEAIAELSALVLATSAEPAPETGAKPAPVSGAGWEGGEGAGSLRGLGTLVAEDLCLLVDGVLVAGVVCFPSHWRLRDKLGLPMAAVHGPVPDYEAELSPRVDRFLGKLRPGLENGVWRRNWTVHHEPDLYAPDVPPPPDPPVTAADAGDRLWLRSERQALSRLPGTGAVAFTIRTQQVPLRALADRPELGRTIRDAVAAWPPHQVAYRGGEAVRTPLLAWLDAHP